MAKKQTPESTDDEAAAPPAPYVVLARKYRPRTFDDLIGQEAMVTTLRNAFASGRIAQGYMLTGVRGVGKTTTARILARAMNYVREGAPDAPAIDMPELGRHCAEIMESRHPDVIEMDAASNTGVDNIREVIESARYRPLAARYKVFVIDEVHMLSKGAFNALLKTLEEPPSHVKFIFATTEIRKVPVTVLSRCQRFDLRRVDVADLAAHFRRLVEKEGATAEEDALLLVARAAEGSVRDGLSILDQAIAMGRGDITTAAVRAMLGLADRGRVFDLLEKLFRGAAGEALAEMASLRRDGAEPIQVLADLADGAHAVARAKILGASAEDAAAPAEEKRRAAALAERLSIPVLSRAFQILVKGHEESARARNPAAAAEMVLIRLAHVADLPSPEDVIASLSGGAPLVRRSQSQPAPGAPPPGGRAPELARLPEAAPAPSAEPPAEPAPSLSMDDGEEAGEDGPSPSLPNARIETFADLLALAGERRDAKLKVHLEEHVSLVKLDAAARSIDVFLLPGAPQGFAAELREKMIAWTGERWIVVLSTKPGAPPAGAIRRESEAANLAALQSHPAVTKVLAAFPGARIVGVKSTEPGGG